MKHNISLLIILVSVLLIGCKQSESEPIPQMEPQYEIIPGLTFYPCFDWTVSNLDNNIGDTIECGFCFSSKTGDPYLEDDHTYSICTQKVVVESSTIRLHIEGEISLDSYDWHYYVRPYIRTRFSARYGTLVIIKPEPVPSFMKTGIITDITSSSANVTYQIASNAQNNIDEYGVEWSTSVEFGSTHKVYNHAYSTDQEKLVSQPVTFTITSLQANTLYYVRAYAKNFFGTSYSDIWTFRTAEK